jgi:hypothetical protein
MLVLTASTAALAQQSPQDLAEAAQNPIAAMISLPLQNNIYGEVGPNHNATRNMLNIQPVIPITLDDRNIISRTIAPLIYQPGLASLPSETSEFGQFSSSHFGHGDINQTFLFSPANATGLIWGVGPKVGDQPMNFNLQAFDYVKSPVGGPRWAVRAQLQLLFPK